MWKMLLPSALLGGWWLFGESIFSKGLIVKFSVWQDIRHTAPCNISFVNGESGY
jgi:hypothetical protein